MRKTATSLYCAFFSAASLALTISDRVVVFSRERGNTRASYPFSYNLLAKETDPSRSGNDDILNRSKFGVVSFLV